MKIRRPDGAVQGGAGLPDQELRSARDDFSNTLLELDAQASAADPQVPSQLHATRAFLEQVATGTNLSNPQEAARGVRQAAEYMITSRLGESLRHTKSARRLVNSLTQYILEDPLLQSKLLGILQRLKSGK